jgi:hypothetical protein
MKRCMSEEKNGSKLPAEFYLLHDELKAEAPAEEYPWDAPVVEAPAEEPPYDELKAEAQPGAELFTRYMLNSSLTEIAPVEQI